MPLVGVMSPVNILNVVVLPAPFTPNKPKHSPDGMVRWIPRTASFLPPWQSFTQGQSKAEVSLYSFNNGVTISVHV